MGLNAADWIRCRLFGEDTSEYTWSRFLRLAHYCTQEYGTALFDVTLGDPELIEKMYKEELEKQSKKVKTPEADDDWHPPRRGYTREVAAMLDVADNLIALRAEMGKWKGSSTRMNPRPLFPAEAVQERLRQRNRSIRDDRIAAAQKRWREKHGGTNSRA